MLYRDTNGRVREVKGQSAIDLALARNPGLRVAQGFRVSVPSGTKKVVIPRKKHYQKSVFTEERDEAHLNAVGDLLEPCIVYRGAFGFGLHECEYHSANGPMGPVFIEEKAPIT